MTRLTRLTRGDLLAIAIVASLFAALAYLGIALTRADERIAMLWLPNAVAAAWLLRSRSAVGSTLSIACVTACAVANIAANRAVGDSWDIAIALSLANAVEIVTVVWLMQKSCGRCPDVTDIRSHRWLLVSALVGAGLSATIAALALVPHTTVPFFHNWQRWILADGFSLLIALPLTLIGIDAWRKRKIPSRSQLIDWALMIGFVVGGSVLVFAQSRYPFLFLASPLVLYAAFRTGPSGTAIAVLIVTTVASIATSLGSGPITLVRGTAEDKIFAFQIFLAVNFAIGLPVAAMLEGRARDRNEIRRSRDNKQEILDNVRDIIFRTDEQGRWTSLNPAWEKLTGYTVAESLGWRTTKLLHPEDFEATAEVYPKIVSGELQEATLIQRFIDRSGDCRHIEVSIRRLADDHGQFAGTIGNISDVTEQTRQAHALAESERRFRNLAESAPIGIFQADTEGQLTFINPSWASKLGKTVDQMLGRGWIDTLASLEPILDDPPFTGFEPGMVRRRTLEFRAADSSSLWMDTYNTAEFDENGKVTGYFGAAVDITEQKQARERLAESESRFQALANLAPAGIFRTNALGHCTYVNAAWLRLTGLDGDNWQGERWGQALHPDDRERVISVWSHAVEYREECRMEFRWLRPDGSTVWVDTIGRPEYDHTGQVVGFIGVNLDVTEHHEAIAALARRDEQLSLITENVTDAVLRLDLDGTCVYASPSAKDLFELPAPALIGANLMTDFHEEDDARVRATFAALARGEKESALIAFRSAAPTDPGRFRWMEANCAPLHDPKSGQPVEIIASIRNVSHTKTLEAELRAARAEAENAATAKSAFLANMSHDIRTPMNGLLGFAELLKGTELDDKQEEYVQMIAESGRGMMQLLNDILDLSKIEAGLMQISLEPVDLRHKLTGVVRLLEPIARDKHVRLELVIDDDIPKWVTGDRLRFRQIALNLIGNAIKFTERGSVTVRAMPSECGKKLEFSVTDTGIGIAEDDLDNIFQQFTQADGSVARRFGGSGLGLSITTQLARLLGGEVTVKSQIGKGSTIMVTLPLETCDAPGKEADDAGDWKEDPDMENSGIRLLIAEDNAINQKLIAAMVRQAGYEATIVEDGNIAIERVAEAAANERQFDLVLMDLQMPGTDGLTATRMLREQGYDPDSLPIVALTANAYPDDIAQCHAAGMQAHIAKPFSLRDLVDNVERFARARTAMPSVASAVPTFDISEKPSLQARYAKRKDDLRALITTINNSNIGERWEELASALHQIAGVAAMFGEPELGTLAAEIEHELGQVQENEGRLALVERSRWALDKAA
ncbi:PAS domain S-box protein [Qipengyuania qiaonensis]|uniref:histidine kinase n=1 Tax=Qipengyuania qiaonensis TaxID=2867240 RepID=A0ABS7JEG9_9SPHN|nr:PAS domain S-box protein [Qipengyuania qiaonensis]MBX7484078.1 PAS domain S-box protein [Qipengyuania qiaonensis]